MFQPFVIRLKKKASKYMELHDEWLFKAKHDLDSAIKLIAGDDPINDTAVYHTQQCAEKALKAFLAYQKKPIEKTHDIEQLVELCAELSPSFSNFLEDAEKLNPYSTFFRYPDDILEPDEADVTEAIDCAEKIYSFVKKLVSK